MEAGCLGGRPLEVGRCGLDRELNTPIEATARPAHIDSWGPHRAAGRASPGARLPHRQALERSARVPLLPRMPDWPARRARHGAVVAGRVESEPPFHCCLDCSPCPAPAAEAAEHGAHLRSRALSSHLRRLLCVTARPNYRQSPRCGSGHTYSDGANGSQQLDFDAGSNCSVDAHADTDSDTDANTAIHAGASCSASLDTRSPAHIAASPASGSETATAATANPAGRRVLPAHECRQLLRARPVLPQVGPWQDRSGWKRHADHLPERRRLALGAHVRLILTAAHVAPESPASVD